MNKLDIALQEMKQAACDFVSEQLRQQFKEDIVAALSCIEWGIDQDKDEWQAKLDKVVDELASRLGDHKDLGYALLYMLQRLIARGFVKATVTHDRSPRDPGPFSEDPEMTLVANDWFVEGPKLFMYTAEGSALDLNVTLDAG